MNDGFKDSSTHSLYTLCNGSDGMCNTGWFEGRAVDNRLWGERRPPSLVYESLVISWQRATQYRSEAFVAPSLVMVIEID